MVNAVVPHADLERTALDWAPDQREEPDLAADAEVRVQPHRRWPGRPAVFAAEATRLAYMTDEAVEGRDAFLEKRDPDFSRFPYYY